LFTLVSFESASPGFAGQFSVGVNTMMLSAGENLLYVSRQLGHADWRMVQERYARWLPSAHGRAAGSAIAQANQETWERLQAMTATERTV
jgi:integrase